MDFKDEDLSADKIVDAFFEEYRFSMLDWKEFLNSKDLGIALIDGWYTITDEKKWALTKIKYGI
jgi:hypothetical protein